jgi:hypothetical protein
MNKTGIARAIEAAGSITALANLLGVTRQVATRYRDAGSVPIYRAQLLTGIYPHIPLRDLVNEDEQKRICALADTFRGV